MSYQASSLLVMGLIDCAGRFKSCNDLYGRYWATLRVLLSSRCRALYDN